MRLHRAIPGRSLAVAGALVTCGMSCQVAGATPGVTAAILPTEDALTVPATTVLVDPQVVTTAGGRPALVWAQPGIGVRVSLRSPTGVWSRPRTVEATTEVPDDADHLLFAAGGGGAVGWTFTAAHDHAGALDRRGPVLAARVPSNGFTSAIAGTAGSIFALRSAAGHAFERFDTATRRWSRARTLPAGALVGDVATSRTGWVAVSYTAGGAALVARRTPAGRWLAPSTVVASDAYPFTQRLSIGPDGTAALAWQLASDLGGVHASLVRADGTVVQAPAAVGQTAIRWATDVAVDGPGAIIVAYARAADDELTIARLVATGGALAAEPPVTETNPVSATYQTRMGIERLDDGSVLVAYRDRYGQAVMVRRRVTGVWQVPLLFGIGVSGPSLRRDALGDGALTHVLRAAGKQVVIVLPIDGAPPRLVSVRVPRRAVRGLAVRLAASATDAWSAPRISWSFGDGTLASGASVVHAWTRTGRFRVVATATDGRGRKTRRTIAVTVVAS